MSPAVTNFCRSFVNTLVYIWTLVLSWCSFRHLDVIVDLERGIQRPQSQDLPLPAQVTLRPLHSTSHSRSSFPPLHAGSSFRHTAHPRPEVDGSPDLPRRIVPQYHSPEPDPRDTSMKPVDGRIVLTSLAVRNDMSASGTNAKHSVSASCDASGTSIIYNANTSCRYDDSPSRSSISTSTSTPSLHVPLESTFHVFRDDQNFKSSRRTFVGHPLFPLTFSSRHLHGKGHRRVPLATITNLSHVMGPSSPVIETFTIPKPSSAIPLMPPVGRVCTTSSRPSPLVGDLADQITVISPPRYSVTSSPHSPPSVTSTFAAAPSLNPATPTSERSLRRVPAFDNLHSPPLSHKLQKASPSPSRKKRPVSSVVWFKNPMAPPTTALRIAKRCAGISRSSFITKAAGKAGVTEKEFKEEVLAVQQAFAMIREGSEDDDGITARERFNRASVWTTRTNRSSMFRLDEQIRNILDEEDDDDFDEEGYGKELPSSSLMCSPPPPYPLSPPTLHITDKRAVYETPTANSLCPVPESTELCYLRSPTSFSSLDESLDDLLSSFEHLIASMPSRWGTH